jgi:hypothetical protein
MLPATAEYLADEAVIVDMDSGIAHYDYAWAQLTAHTGDGHLYGRPYAYRHHAAEKDYLGAWTRIDAPILVNFNEYDQFEELRGAEIIVDTANRLRPGNATLAWLADNGLNRQEQSL